MAAANGVALRGGGRRGRAALLLLAAGAGVAAAPAPRRGGAGRGVLGQLRSRGRRWSGGGAGGSRGLAPHPGRVASRLPRGSGTGPPPARSGWSQALLCDGLELPRPAAAALLSLSGGNLLSPSFARSAGATGPRGCRLPVGFADKRLGGAATVPVTSCRGPRYRCARRDRCRRGRSPPGVRLTLPLPCRTSYFHARTSEVQRLKKRVFSFTFFFFFVATDRS